jgi:hypothetical protein
MRRISLQRLCTLALLLSTQVGCGSETAAGGDAAVGVDGGDAAVGVDGGDAAVGVDGGDAAVGNDGGTPDAGAPEVTKAFSPGHWIGASHNFDSLADFAIDNVDSFVGVLIKVWWNTIEDETPGVYDWTEVWSVIQKLKPHGLKLALFLQDKSFGNAPRPTPSYMLDDPQYDSDGWVRCYLEDQDKSHGYPAFWDPDVTDRWIALFQAAREEFESEPTVEMLVTSETVWPCLKNELQVHEQDFYNETYRYTEEIIYDLRNTSILFNKGMNWNQNVISGLCDRCFERGAAVGGPDILADTVMISETDCYQPRNHGVGVANDLTIAVQVQTMDYCNHGTLQQIWNKAVGPEINANMVIWYREPAGCTFSIDDVIAKIDGDRTRDIETLLPLNLQPDFALPW